MCIKTIKYLTCRMMGVFLLDPMRSGFYCMGIYSSVTQHIKYYVWLSCSCLLCRFLLLLLTFFQPFWFYLCDTCTISDPCVYTISVPISLPNSLNCRALFTLIALIFLTHCHPLCWLLMSQGSLEGQPSKISLKQMSASQYFHWEAVITSTTKVMHLIPLPALGTG